MRAYSTPRRCKKSAVHLVLFDIWRKCPYNPLDCVDDPRASMVMDAKRDFRTLFGVLYAVALL
jgi:hypothetical protein